MENKRKNILIHPDHLEDLDKKYKRLEENRKEPVKMTTSKEGFPVSFSAIE